MGAVFRRDKATDEHVATGKYPHREGHRHTPVWGPWSAEWPGVWMRPCQHPDGCDVDDVTNEEPA